MPCYTDIEEFDFTGDPGKYYWEADVRDKYLYLRSVTSYKNIDPKELELLLQDCKQLATMDCLIEFGSCYYRCEDELTEYFNELVTKHMLKRYNIDYPINK